MARLGAHPAGAAGRGAGGAVRWDGGGGSAFTALANVGMRRTVGLACWRAAWRRLGLGPADAAPASSALPPAWARAFASDGGVVADATTLVWPPPADTHRGLKELLDRLVFFGGGRCRNGLVWADGAERHAERCAQPADPPTRAPLAPQGRCSSASPASCRLHLKTRGPCWPHCPHSAPSPPPVCCLSVCPRRAAGRRRGLAGGGPVRGGGRAGRAWGVRVCGAHGGRVRQVGEARYHGS